MGICELYTKDGLKIIFGWYASINNNTIDIGVNNYGENVNDPGFKLKGFVLVDDQLNDLDEDDCNYILTGFLIGGRWTHDVSLFLKTKFNI